MKRIVLTGGGTAGHVTPNMALVPKLIDEGYDIAYIGSYEGMERKLIDDIGVPYYGISSGKLRRYFDLKNFTDPFRVIKGYFEAKKILKKLHPNVVFSKGGFVTVPVVIAAKKLHIPVIIHESDMTPGLANKLSIPSASKVCCNFPETIEHLPKGKAVLTGSPIRQELFQGRKETGLKLCGFQADKPVLLIIGGSLGSVAINNAIRHNLDELLKTYQIIHLCGRGNLDQSLDTRKGYRQFEYVKDDLKHYFACADVVVSRAGANAICELLALRKPNVLIPLGLNASRGDQILNAKSFEKQGYSYVLQEEDVTSETLLNAVNTVYSQRQTYINAMNQSKLANPIETIVNLANELASGR
ncbi:undecaprenyldiphospho-muramoylpentapeptide beta-N-acetylglucosaminyltransferase [Anaerostipes butyraticus]|mgnify:FL=1|uniref:UDP-N-acetylglucosamine--N-acetylmuramyl-(pentapeptide) pyrophosphoryl-undecaprenol N-acetylglucosamine transferase n=1 Tax=Anaerostipes butyraticus TaxID=645466 RepID=A0A916Q3K9_9FIRM|nr:undecaprenyldiphospho-muramoylpentapeptide beta-N-acetylglucosaminyltransferase [Anaerostipes butyraticus]GFO83672.1 UDP-N-acetylglucosamine--N-acetylmuramyl-(pentapeptide) pyrophosphoryl-undecaprenol N-acetylglucosamine transferase [Anaerostipes butyraticus]